MTSAEFMPTGIFGILLTKSAGLIKSINIEVRAQNSIILSFLWPAKHFAS